MMNNNNYLPQYNTMLFSEVYESGEAFLEDYHYYGEYIPCELTDNEASTCFWLLMARYCNNPIAQLDVNQFKMRLFATIFQYGPTWAKRLDIQKKLRNLEDSKLLEAREYINNHAYNPDTAPSTTAYEALPFINEQNSSKQKRNYLDAYAYLWDLLKVDVTKEFVDKFNGLFKVFVYPEHPTLYRSIKEDD